VQRSKFLLPSPRQRCRRQRGPRRRPVSRLLRCEVIHLLIAVGFGWNCRRRSSPSMRGPQTNGPGPRLLGGADVVMTWASRLLRVSRGSRPYEWQAREDGRRPDRPALQVHRTIWPLFHATGSERFIEGSGAARVSGPEGAGEETPSVFQFYAMGPAWSTEQVRCASQIARGNGS